MKRTDIFQIRVTPEERKEMHDTSSSGGWKSVADMVRDLVKEATSLQLTKHQPENAQHQPGHHGDEPQL